LSVGCVCKTGGWYEAGGFLAPRAGVCAMSLKCLEMWAVTVGNFHCVWRVALCGSLRMAGCLVDAGVGFREYPW